MGDIPDPDEEYELMYADEFELLREAEENGKHKQYIYLSPSILYFLRSIVNKNNHMKSTFL